MDGLMLGCPGQPWYIGRGPEGSVALYSDSGAEIVKLAFLTDLRMARRAVRACRRAMDSGPMRLRVSVTEERPGGREWTDTVDVYGWRAALTAVRAMRAEVRPCGSSWERRRWLVTLVSDARLDDVLFPEE